MLLGCDISEFQSDDVDISPYDFVIVRSSYGVNAKDAKMDTHARRVLNAGKLLGFYHYAYPDTGNTGAAEARSMLSYVQSYLGQCILCLDWEGDAVSYPVSWIQEFMETIKSETGITPFFYTFAAQLSNTKYQPLVGKYPLWVAHWGVTSPSTGVFGSWVLWQYQGDPFDLDRFDGTAQDWANWCGEAKGEWISKNDWLTQAEMQNNARMLWKYFEPLGWTLEAVAAMLGNMEVESNINPGIWGDLDPSGDPDTTGYGLVQWTPYTRITNWLSSHGYSLGDGDAECAKIQEEMAHPEIEVTWISVDPFDMTFAEFSRSTLTPEYLADAFLKCYERPYDQDQPIRGTYARKWYNYLLSGGVFVPRLDDSGMEGNPYWYADNPFYQAGYGLPNCTCYAWGRRWEITGIRPDNLSLGNASRWFDDAVAAGLKTGQTPQLGAIACYDYEGGGHVSIVEKINADGSIVTSNSAWGGAYFYTSTLYPPNYFWNGMPSDAVFEGFIYLDSSPIGPEPPEPAPSSEGSSWIYYLNPFRWKE